MVDIQDIHHLKLVTRHGKLVIKMYRIGVISDTRIHSENEKLPEKVIEAFENVDLILHAGNIFKEHVLERLEEIAPVHAVRGALDKPEDFTRELPEKKILKIDDYRIGLFNEFPGNKVAMEHGINILIHGNTCIPRIKESKEIRLILNPGTPFAKHSLKYKNGTIILLKMRGQMLFSYIIKV